ncbi:hypothetical protein Nepgr_032772 [Nepenthes gracilis]|uniref:TF-B3 domain-containing protein n=1 Tax=Nepenthes gracilis TaxID=150966 RepID=A0AAD3Y850_NEPGR|nr:hypothetical protein Nepgr_032772 [Nepenthes gracilis]
MELLDEDLHVEMEDGFENFVGVGDERNPSRPEAERVMSCWDADGGGGVKDREIWNGQNDLIDVSDPSLLYSYFPPLPDFPCMSSASSSFTPATAKLSAGSSSLSACSSASSAGSRVMLQSDAEVDHDVDRRNHHHLQDHHGQQVNLHGFYHDHHLGVVDGTSSVDLSSTDQRMDDADCMDVMENFGVIDLLDSDDIWDPSPLFEDDDGHNQSPLEFQQEELFLQHEQSQLQLHLPQEVDHEDTLMMQDINTSDNQEQCTIEDDVGCCSQSSTTPNSEDLAMVFFEWLKSNKESISAEDMRNIKIKKSTVECAAKRLGGGKEGTKHLLKLILQWVQNYHLQNKRMKAAAAAASADNTINNFPTQTANRFCDNTSNNPVPSEGNPCLSSLQWLPRPRYITDPITMGPTYIAEPINMAPPPQQPSFLPVVGYVGPDPYASGGGTHYYPSPTDQYRMLDAAPSWPPSPPPHFALPLQHYSPLREGTLPAPPHPHSFTGNQYPYPFLSGPGDGTLRLGSSATKEARKKRMARQRRFLSHHHYRSHSSHLNNAQEIGDQHSETIGDNGCAAGLADAKANHGAWVWPEAASGPAPAAEQMQNVDPPPAANVHSCHRQQIGSDKKQGWKTEKNLKFLLQKVLKQSDVGNLGRIVLPKKEAETHLPELEARDGIPIAMEDLGTSQVWNMRYRFWPNNKSRMYLLENTGDFVRSNGLQEGDFIVIYSDVKCGKYMIRGMKARPTTQGPKSETKKTAKTTQKTQGTSSPSAK